MRIELDAKKMKLLMRVIGSGQKLAVLSDGIDEVEVALLLTDVEEQIRRQRPIHRRAEVRVLRESNEESGEELPVEELG